MRYTLIIIYIAALYSCRDKGEQIQIDVQDAEQKVLVINEGNFQWGNASLGYYNPGKMTYQSNAFEAINKIPMGDVFNSITTINHQYWCVMNNSGLIHVIDSATLQLRHTIKGFKSPRHVCDGGNGFAYVSDLYADGISVVSLEKYTIIAKIKLKGWTELMLMAGSKLWVTSSERPYVYLIEPLTNVIEDSIQIGNLANSILRANNAMVLILCEGKLGSSELAELYQIDTKARQVISKYSFNAGEKPRFLRQSTKSGKLYLVNNGLFGVDDLTFRVGQKLMELPTSIYGFNISTTGEMYFSDGRDFVQKSVISVYSEVNFDKLFSFEAGVNANGFVFQ